MKYLFFIASLAIVLQSLPIHPQDNNKKIYVLIKKDNEIWDSGPLRFARSIGYYGFSFIGYLYLINACFAPFARNSFSCFADNLLMGSISLSLAELLKIREKDLTISWKKQEPNNFVIIEQ